MILQPVAQFLNNITDSPCKANDTLRDRRFLQHMVFGKVTLDPRYQGEFVRRYRRLVHEFDSIQAIQPSHSYRVEPATNFCILQTLHTIYMHTC